MTKTHQRFAPTSNSQTGINMVDLMMWLVIAALLLAAAIQGVGYYHRAAIVYQLSSDVAGAGQNVLTQASMSQGVVTEDIATEGVANTKVSSNSTSLTPEVQPDGYFTIDSYTPELSGYRVVYSSEARDGLKAGVNLVPLGEGEVNPGQLGPNVMGESNAAEDGSGWYPYGGTNGGHIHTFGRVASGGPTSALPSFMRMSWTEPLVGGPNGPVIYYSKEPVVIEAGKTYETAVWMRSNQSVRAGTATSYFDSANNRLDMFWHDFSLEANEWVHQKKTWTAPAGSVTATVLPHLKEGVSLPAGATFDVVGVTVREVR